MLEVPLDLPIVVWAVLSLRLAVWTDSCTCDFADSKVLGTVLQVQIIVVVFKNT